MNGAEEPGSDGTRPREDASAVVVEPLLRMTRVLVGVAIQAVEQLDEEVSLTQFRLLLVLSELGPTPNAQVAARLGSVASSVTRLADRLEDDGYLIRHRARPNRSIVRLELTDSGRELVRRVVSWREAELQRFVGELPARTRTELARAVGRFCDLAEPGYGAGPGPVPV